MHVLVIGSSLFDVFVSLENNPHVAVEANKASFNLGDKIPVDMQSFAIGGNGPNVASALQKLSVSNAFYTYLGEDALSLFIKQQLSKEGITLYFEETKSLTGPLSLIFEFPTDRTIFSHHPEFNHGFKSSKVTQTPTHIFLTSIGKEWTGAYESVLEYAQANNISIAFSPGSAQLKEINEVFIKTVHQSKMLLCNMEEAKIISEKLSGNSIEDKKELLLNLKNYGFELLSITDGANGAYAVDNKNSVWKIETMKPEGHEKTGAGDAYAAAFLASYLQDLPIEECMKRGVLNSIGVMSKVGAHTGQLTKEEIEQKSQQTSLVAQII